jgi:8-hydroxy-5-deazaflavin:NADPH oxidoreductase
MVRTVGILGVGRVGSAVARTALRAGYVVNVAGSGAGSDIELLVDIVIPGARAMSAADAVADVDLVIVAVPLHKYGTVSPHILAGKIVIDAMNYWSPVDGRLHDFESDGRSSSEVISDYFSGSRVVKTLNHIGYHELETDGLPAGSEHRRALAVAGDDEAAVGVVRNFIDRLGFDAVHTGPLQTGASFQPGTAIFGASYSANGLRAELGLIADTRSLIGAELG